MALIFPSKAKTLQHNLIVSKNVFKLLGGGLPRQFTVTFDPWKKLIESISKWSPFIQTSSFLFIGDETCVWLCEDHWLWSIVYLSSSPLLFYLLTLMPPLR